VATAGLAVDPLTGKIPLRWRDLHAQTVEILPRNQRELKLKTILSRIITILLAIVVAFFCISAFLSLFQIAATIMAIYEIGADRYGLGYLAGQVIFLIFSVAMIYGLGKLFKKLEW
jgi:hypothetical protein